MPTHSLHPPVLAWYVTAARDLPWRRADRTAWGVLVSEFMLQQTPVARVLPVWQAWLDQWPTARDLAQDTPAQAIRSWGRLGYPRRALRLHATAVALVDRHDGAVPSSTEDLLALPGVGDYTAAAVASFAFGNRHVVLDTNVRRVFTRAITGRAEAGAPTVAQARLAADVLPDDPAEAVRWAAASMELGALVCTARAPRCGDCPILDSCAWQQAGCPASDATPKRSQAYLGTDRQVRGQLLAVLRATPEPVPRSVLLASLPPSHRGDGRQPDRCLGTLLADGLVQRVDGEQFRLPC